MEEFIKVERGVIKEIAKEHKVSRQFVSRILNGDLKPQKAKLIRAVAMQKGGKLCRLVVVEKESRV